MVSAISKFCRALPVAVPLVFNGSVALGMEGRPTSKAAPPFAPPQFNFRDDTFNDYRPAISADGAKVVFERNRVGQSETNLFLGDLQTNGASTFVSRPSERADWCWNRSRGGRPTVGPIAFSNAEGIWRVDANGQNLRKLPGTQGMIYPAWYPDCSFLAADVVSPTRQGSDRWYAAKIDATGKVVASHLAGKSVWTGFPSVNPVDPKIVAFAAQPNGQTTGTANYYNQDLNYTFVTSQLDSAQGARPLEPQASLRFGFIAKFQARAGWWSPDGRWFAFESNRNCSNPSGEAYAIFIVDSAGRFPPMQVSDCAKWNAQHPKWYPPGPDGVSTKLIAAVAQANGGPHHIATFDVSAFVR